MLMLSVLGCGMDAADDAQGGIPPAISPPTPSVVDESAPPQDPVLQFPQELVWREFWFPIENTERDTVPTTRALLEVAGVRSGMRVADVGAGGGYFAFRWARAVGPTGHVYAIDIDWRMTRKLAWEAAARGVTNLTARKVTVGTLGIEASSVDVVAMVDIGIFNACNADEHRGYIEQAARGLRPGGRLVVLQDVRGGEPRMGERACTPLSADAVAGLASTHFSLATRTDLVMGEWRAFLMSFTPRAAP